MTDAEMIAELRDRIGSEFDDELHLSRAEAERLLALAKDAQAAQAAHAEAERLREALAPFVAATGQHDDGSVWYETARVPGSAWEQARRAALAQEQRDE